MADEMVITPLPEEPEVLNISSSAIGNTPNATVPASISSMGELQRLSPQLYNAILQSMAWVICSQSNDSVQRQKELLDEADREK
jgi:hypothetical protein